jgi:hypothetical protein
MGLGMIGEHKLEKLISDGRSVGLWESERRY